MRYKLAFIISLCILMACHNSKKGTKDKFYKRKGGIDYTRLPLIKPYEAIRLNGSKEWLINLKKMTLQFSISNVKQISVKHDVIMVHCENTFLRGNEVNEAWFVIVPSKELEIGFDTFYDFNSYLTNNGLSKKVMLHDIDKMYSEFDKMDTMNWSEKMQ